MAAPRSLPVRLAVLALALAVAPATDAQDVPLPLPLPTSSRAPSADALQLAAQLLDNGQTSEAIALLEDLVRQSPDAFPLALRLRNAYFTAGRYDEAVGVVDGWIERMGPTPQFLADRGALLHRAGRAEEARASWDAAIALQPDAETTYRAVATAVAELQLYEEAAEVLERGTARLSDDPFLLETAHLYGLARDYDRSAALYLSLIGRDPQVAPAVRDRLAQLLQNPEALPGIAAAIERSATADPLNRSFREMSAWIALEQEDYDGALAATRALDRLEGEQGRMLLLFAQSAVAADALEVADRALGEALDRYPDGPSAPAARLARAELADRRSRAAGERADLGPTPLADAARESYLAYLDGPSDTDRADAAALALAELERDVAQDFDVAERFYTRATTARDPALAGRALLGLGEVALRRGDLDAARETFAQVDETLGTGPLAEEARFELARLDLYEGYFLSALARIEAMDENTAAEVSNDAIALRVTLSENAEEASADSTGSHPLRWFARASLLHRQSHDADALAALDSLLAGAPGTPLTDDALFLKAGVLRALGRPADAVAALDALAERDPLSFFRDRALLLQAQLYEGPLGDPAEAAVRYERLLELFPGSLFAPEARLQLRRLRSSA